MERKNEGNGKGVQSMDGGRAGGWGVAGVAGVAEFRQGGSRDPEQFAPDCLIRQFPR